MRLLRQQETINNSLSDSVSYLWDEQTVVSVYRLMADDTNLEPVIWVYLWEVVDEPVGTIASFVDDVQQTTIYARRISGPHSLNVSWERFLANPESHIVRSLLK